MYQWISEEMPNGDFIVHQKMQFVEEALCTRKVRRVEEPSLMPVGSAAQLYPIHTWKPTRDSSTMNAGIDVQPTHVVPQVKSSRIAKHSHQNNSRRGVLNIQSSTTHMPNIQTPTCRWRTRLKCDLDRDRNIRDFYKERC